MLIDKAEFVGLESIVHLCAGGETPMLRSHAGAVQQFMEDKAQGEAARQLIGQKMNATRDQCAGLYNVPAADLTFLSSASEGINVVAYGLDWRPGDNVVIADVEFPSGVYPWIALQHQGVEVRVAKHQEWEVSLEAIAKLIDDRTRVVLLSHVSMYTGQRIDLPALSALVRSRGAALVLDATHATGVVPVEASLADVVVSSCYKWMLGVHGTALFYWNRDSLPELKPPFLGWDSAASAAGWQEPLKMDLHEDAHRFKSANPSYISLYILNNALNNLLPLGIENIEKHALDLGGLLREGAAELGFAIMTPEARSQRAGNVCIMSDRVDAIAAALDKRDVKVWGTYGGADRLRISAHVYNSREDIELCLDALRSVQK